jgi:orotate phosphoribosyltransferase-like protein
MAVRANHKKLQSEGAAIKAIARELKMSRNTVKKYLYFKEPPRRNVTKNQFKAKHNSQLLTKSSDLFERNVQQETGILATFGWFQLPTAL